ncbi:AAA family ATPase [Microcoleus sp. FACHB-672]|uniref:AAA family ATPase n=1 Tax=Microcoleus sp. FACHB-672 TaxID=2692825 RepID=UPI00168281D1|nr:AAA family ATPase [Microcoleus sp. FACHB-672]MBD2041890.1 AAA family ATPase [Microcoleus sp. FACHB-672]
MLSIPGVTVQTLLYESASSLIYRAARESDSQPIILKLLKDSYPTPQELVRYRTEYRITRSLEKPGVVQVYDLQKYQNTLVMFVEDFGGESLAFWMQRCRFSLEEFLQIAIEAARSLGQIHAAGVIHKDINPSNIVYNRQTGQLKIIDFSISTQLTRENPVLKTPGVLEGTLAYISPEQTGRMNRVLDYRTDFYSLGISFYQILTNQLPFTTTDPLELVHCHIAKQPLPPSEVNLGIPQLVSDIVMKLIAKTAEERYQSAYGLQADLEECRQQLHSTGIISNFPLGRHDISDKFQLPQKLYGRQLEIETLLAAFERASDFKSELMLIAGYSGIGKSALVQEIYKPITKKRGYFITGKFDQYQRNIPYSGIIRAFQELIKQLLTESEAQLNQWRKKLLEALGLNGQVIVEVIPELELIVGKQTAVPELGPDESQNRFNLAFKNFIKVFTQPEHPLALFLDDLQWSDGASLKLMQLLMNAASPGLFLMGAYRDNEVGAAHPLMLAVEEIAKKGAIINRIFLSPLDFFSVSKIICEALNSSEEKVKVFAELVEVKTGGNPFFMNEFLKSLYTENLLKFDIQSLSWQWELEQIKARDFTDNVVELMAGKIQKLPKETQEILKLAACIGNQFDLNLLTSILKKPLRETTTALFAAVAENLVTPLNNMGDVELALIALELPDSLFSITQSQSLEYKFVHDRIQQAAYSLIPTNTKEAVHRQIGQFLLKNTPPNKREEKIFDIVNKFNFALKLITERTEKDDLAQLNLTAGKKAKLSAAYQPALTYLQTGIELLASDSWQQQYHLTLSLYEQAAEAAYLNADFNLMNQFIEAVLSRAKTVLDKVKAYEVKIQAHVAQAKLNKAIHIALEILNLLGVKLPKQPNNLDILWGLLQAKLKIGSQPIASLVDLPVMTDPYPKAAMRILAKIAGAAYSSAPMLMPLIVFQKIRLSIEWGNTSESAFAYSFYGLILCGVVGDIETGYQFGQLALNLLSRLNTREVKARTEFIVHVFIRHWIEPVKETLNSLREAYAVALETGDLEYAAYSVHFYCCYAFLSGKELEQLELEIETYAQAMRQIGQERTDEGDELYYQEALQLLSQAALNLLGHSQNPCYLIGTAYDERAMLPVLEKANDRTGSYYVYFKKLILCYLFGEQGQAVANAELAEKYIDGGTALLWIPQFYFYDSLVRLALATNAEQPSSKAEKKLLQNRTIQKVISNQKKMKKWAHHAPRNNSHKYQLVEAELCRLLGKDPLAVDYYDKAITLAKDNEYIHEAAIAYELAAKFYLSKGKELAARSYMQEARYCYQLWGAVAKIKDLETRYPQLLTTTQSGIQAVKTSVSVTTTGTTSNLDIATALKASQAISGEIILDKLLSSLMKILMENAGAQKGYLVLPSQGNLLVEASGSISNEQVTVLQSIPLETCGGLSEAIINYVARTKESVVLDDAAQEGQFTKESYIQNNQIKSILCVPLINQGQLISIVYLENNLTAGAFTPERVELLQLLSGQAAISIQNSKLYTEVRENESRLAQLNQAYERFVPSQFLQFLEKSSIIDVELGDQVQLEMSVLFSDIRDFTTLSESMTPADNFKFINSYLSRMEPAITENHGFIDKYIGDAIMALFSGEADNAVKAGIAMLHRLTEYNQHRRKFGYPPIQNGIGINTGTLMLGTVGGQNRMDGTVISDAVNLASRVESLTKNYGVSLLITEQTYSRLKNSSQYAIRTIDTVKVKGKSEAVTVYEVFDANPPEIKEGKLATLPLFAEALEFYSEGKLAEAARLFKDCLCQNQGDLVAQIYFERCQKH